jgi:hypothetical protein
LTPATTPAIHYLNETGEEWDSDKLEYVAPSGACPGIVSGLPAAEPGQLCIYVSIESGFANPNAMSVTRAGASISYSNFSVPETELFIEEGAWALTG